MPSIAILGSRGVPNSYGGFEAYAQNLALGLSESGWKVTVACESKLRRYPFTHRGIYRVFFPVPETLRFFWEFIYEWAFVLWAFFARIDVVYLLGYPASFLAWLPRLSGKRVYLNPDGFEWKREMPVTYRKLFQLAELLSHITPTSLVYDSRELKHIHESEYPYKQGYYLPFPYSSGEGTPSSSIYGYYLVVARFIPENNLETILKAFLASDTDRRLLIVANWRSVDEQYVSRVMKLAGVDSRIHLLKGIYDGTLPDLRRHAFCYIHGHSVGGSNPSLVEAMDAEAPILAFKTIFNVEVCGKEALYWRDEAELRDKIRIVEHHASLVPVPHLPFRFDFAYAVSQHDKLFRQGLH
jgi:glycosyltransferase involved in cell wall biosynthesis